ncbi:hypothetical protein KM043_010368 [Ampulex compressa]|nr:hypothetical protein KM043_010368 [Ampulex compressa]
MHVQVHGYVKLDFVIACLKLEPAARCGEKKARYDFGRKPRATNRCLATSPFSASRRSIAPKNFLFLPHTAALA